VRIFAVTFDESFSFNSFSWFVVFSTNVVDNCFALACGISWNHKGTLLTGVVLAVQVIFSIDFGFDIFVSIFSLQSFVARNISLEVVFALAFERQFSNT